MGTIIGISGRFVGALSRVVEDLRLNLSDNAAVVHGVEASRPSLSGSAGSSRLPGQAIAGADLFHGR